MRLTPVLNLPPKFHYWKEFGAGRRKRMPVFKEWWNIWRYRILRKEPVDHTVPLEMLPQGSRLMAAEDFMIGHIDALPDEILQRKSEKIVYDHPWPFNFKVDPLKLLEPRYLYNSTTRFFVPRDDCQALTNTLIETEPLKANPPLEPSEEVIAKLQHQHVWVNEGDSVLVKLPKVKPWPRMNAAVARSYGITTERKESNLLISMQDMAFATLANHYAKDQEKLMDLMQRRSVAFPNYQVPVEREGYKICFDLCVDNLVSSLKPLPIMSDPETTRQRPGVSIHPRGWRSLLEKSRQTMEPSNSLPDNLYPHTAMIVRRTKRQYREDEMLAKLVIHAFAMASQFRVKPVVVQAIGRDQADFHFLKYQLNSAEFADDDESRLKNQAWYSGPISNLSEAFRFYLDFHK